MAAPDRRRRPRARAVRGASRVGARFTVEVGAVAHGGHCVARVAEEGDRVVFVRHALPGERVVLQVTEGTDGDRFWRADAVEVLRASPDRVDRPCPFAGPDLCGGCDFQHVALPAQRELKAAVVREQLVRLGRVSAEHPLVAGLVVEPVAGDVDGLRWRTRMQYVALPGGRRGMRKHRSHEVVQIDDCRIAAPGARELGGPNPSDPAGAVVEVVDTDFGSREHVVEAGGFWQVHPGAPRALVETVLGMLQPQAGERVLDLYAGVGLFAGFLADALGEAGRVVAVEADVTACGHARENLRQAGGRTTVVSGAVDVVLGRVLDEPFDVVVLDPPREGARRKVVEQVVALGPRAVAYVACDPAALARDVAVFAEHGYALAQLRAFDLFPMTHHVECVALFTRRVS